MPQRVLIIDDEPDIRELLEITLNRMSLHTTAVGDLTSARQLLASEKFDFCLTDMHLPDGNGLELVSEVQQLHQHLPIAVITAFGSTDTAITALKAGAFDFVQKPVDLQKLRTLVQSALKLAEQPVVAESDAIANDGIVGKSPAILGLKQQIQKLARSQAPIFIAGESGSGKELAARAIHRLGPRKDKDFVAINCGAIPAELMESEFFGHKKGSFTGADQDKVGLFQAAHGGSLFLDEIADLPLLMQVKMLRALQEKTIRPIGAQTEIPVDVRLLSASHKNLAKAVEQGLFRQDLYYRINVIELAVPPLRERREDLPLLVRHILQNMANQTQSPPFSINPEALQQLQGYHFPGNVRELENMLQRACALADTAVIQTHDFPELSTPVQEAAASTNSTVIDATPANDASTSSLNVNAPSFSLEKHLEAIEREAIQKALLDNRWNQTAAAKQLGMTLRSLRYRIQKLGVE